MKKIILTMSMSIAPFVSVGNIAHAADGKVHEVSFNASLVSEYRYRGISQTRRRPALQGGMEYAHTPSGFYAGTWLSTIKWIKDVGGDGNIEWDIYGGKKGTIKGTIAEGLSYDIGVLRYLYPSNKLPVNANTTELYGQIGFGVAYLKYSHATTNLFGFTDSEKSRYVDIGANIDMMPGWILNLHAGHQTVKGAGNDPFSYTDWKVGVTKDFGVLTGSLAAIGTNSDAYLGPAPELRNLGETRLVVSASKTF